MHNRKLNKYSDWIVVILTIFVLITSLNSKGVKDDIWLVIAIIGLCITITAWLLMK